MSGFVLQNYPIILAFILLITLVYYVYYRAKKYIARYKHILKLYKAKVNGLRNDIVDSKVSENLHNEELLATTEHLKELNFELERLSLVANKTDTAVAIADHKGRFVFINQGFVSLFGYTLGDLIDKVGHDIYSIVKNLNILPDIDPNVEFKTSINYTAEVKTKSGELKWVKTVLNPIFDDRGRVNQYIIILTDVSELKAINEKLEKLSLVASSTNNSVVIFNNNLEIDWVNEGFHKMYGYNKEEFIDKNGKSLLDFLTLDNKAKVLDELLSSRDSVSYISNFLDKLGTEKWKQSSLTPIFNDEQKLHTLVLVESDITRIKQAEQEIQKEKEKSDKLLLNILPAETAEELKTSGSATPRFYRSVSVLFADIQDFTKLAENLTPVELVNDLQKYFSRFDDVVTRNFVEKIKTMGDAFLCVGGIPIKNKSHAFDAVLVGLELQRIIKSLGKEQEAVGKRALQLRVGIHSGPVVAGVVGKQKMTYDIWGDTVNIAKRFETACVPGMVNVSSSTYEMIKDYFECEHRGKVWAKHKGDIDMYFVYRLKPEFSVNGEGVTPNNYFQEMLAQL